MYDTSNTSRRTFIAGVAALLCAPALSVKADTLPPNHAESFLEEIHYGDVQLQDREQFDHCMSVLANLSEDSMLRPYRERAGLPAPGENIGGWYANNFHYDPNLPGSEGFAPGHCFGQWLSALARGYAITGNDSLKDKLDRLISEFDKTICDAFFVDLRFPAYTYDKLVGGLIDAHQFAHTSSAFNVLDRLTKAALPHLPDRAIDRGSIMNPKHSQEPSYTWDESYTLPENLFLAYARGAGSQYLQLAKRYLKDDTYFEPLSRNVDVLPDKHAYSYMNALSSAMVAYMMTGSDMHFSAAKNAFEMIRTDQSFATGGWGPDERFRKPGLGELGESLNNTHSSFETPCGSYAHFKLMRYLLRTTRDGKYGDSMERVMYNTVLGALPLGVPGRAFYYADYNFKGKKVYHGDKCPCCAGTLPQVAADYGINAFFHDPNGVFVNLYLPSVLTWKHKENLITFTQTGSYALEGSVKIAVATSASVRFSLHLRVPEWTAGGTKIIVNGNQIGPSITDQFAHIDRQWKDGDTIEVALPMPFRLESVDSQHANVVALLRGPLVLFAVTDQPVAATRDQLLAAIRVNDSEWRVDTVAGAVRFLPFQAIKNEQYSTYVQVSS